uniref:Uncharacterized protein n=1 Tax=Oryza sativa subsp. japonica TaxID=39947 RepID=Q655T8_ORYSJ|nr:hypothetical protein [Oryza sativa Japonica Group]BAD45429.1 hypothetical protein [Oryza sativa Japonica Group]
MEALTMLPPAAAATTAAEAFNCFFPEEEKGVAASSTLLQLWPQPHDGDQPDLRLWIADLSIETAYMVAGGRGFHGRPCSNLALRQH